MFDYHAGEKYKLTLIMVGFAGVMVGAFFSILLIGDQSGPPPSQRQRPKWADHPDVTGKANPAHQPMRAADGSYATDGVNTRPSGMAEYNPADEKMSMELISEWLPKAWDLSAGTAGQSQEQAILYMTPECAQAYRQNIWTNEMAQQVEESGLQSQFSASSVAFGSRKDDGSVVILVHGMQVLQVPGKGVKERPVNIEYLVKQTKDGLRIAGIQEGAHGS